MKLEEDLVQRGLRVNDEIVLKLVHAKDLTLKQRLMEVAYLLIPTILDSTSVMNLEDNSIDISESSGVFGGMVYLASILRGKRYVIKVYKK